MSEMSLHFITTQTQIIFSPLARLATDRSYYNVGVMLVCGRLWNSFLPCLLVTLRSVHMTDDDDGSEPAAIMSENHCTRGHCRHKNAKPTIVEVTCGALDVSQPLLILPTQRWCVSFVRLSVQVCVAQVLHDFIFNNCQIICTIASTLGKYDSRTNMYVCSRTSIVRLS